MSNYKLVSEPEAYVAVSGLGSYIEENRPDSYVAVSGYVAQPEPEAYVAVSGLGEDPVAPKAEYYVPGTTVVREKESMTGMWLLLALATGSAGYMYWRLRQAGVPLAPAKGVAGLDELGHSGRTSFYTFPKHRGYGHYRQASGRFHFHRR